MKFWDTSAIVPLLLREQSTEKLLGVHAGDPAMIIWWSSRTEVISAVCRQFRSINSDIIDAAVSAFENMVLTGKVIPPSWEILLIAERLLRLYALRAADAHQLAAAIVASENEPASLPFVCLDDRLIEAARKEGFRIAL